MTRLRYAKGERFCKQGGHFVTDEEIVLSKVGQRLCKEHRQIVRTRPRSKKYREKYKALLKVRADI